MAKNEVCTAFILSKEEVEKEQEQIFTNTHAARTSTKLQLWIDKRNFYFYASSKLDYEIYSDSVIQKKKQWYHRLKCVHRPIIFFFCLFWFAFFCTQQKWANVKRNFASNFKNFQRQFPAQMLLTINQPKKKRLHFWSF